MKAVKASSEVLRFVYVLASLVATAFLPGAQGAIFVDPSITTPSCTTYNPTSCACNSGSETAYQTFAGAVAATTPGSIVLIRAGIYHESLTPLISGTADEPIIFQRFQTETVVIEGPSLDPAIALHGVSNIIVDGIIVTNVIGWVDAVGASWNILRNCTFLKATAAGSRGGLKFLGSHHNKIVNNLLDGGWFNLSLIDSDFNVVAGNSFRRAGYALWNIRCGNFNVIRGNSFSNHLGQIGVITDCEGWPTATPFKADATKFNLVDGNTFEFTPPSLDGSVFRGLQCSGQKTIVRRNRFFNTSGPGIQIALHSDNGDPSDDARYATATRAYHNVFYATRYAGIQLPEPDTNRFSGHVFKNNILSQSVFLATNSPRPWHTNELLGKPVQVLTGRRDGYLFEGNNILGTAPNQLYAIAYGVQASTSNAPQQTLTGWQQAYPALFSNNLEVLPQFVNTGAGDFRLAGGSPLIDAGVFLTRANSAGSGTVFSVEDASYFYDGFGISGELGDVIQLQGQTQAVRVVHIDYPNNLLTVSQPLTWTAGQGVALRFNGNAPDVGAFNYPDLPPQLTLVDQPQGQQATLGTNVTFGISFISSEPPIFQWQKDGRILRDDGKISGATTCCLTISDIQSRDVGGYRVLLASEAGSVTSQVATISLLLTTNDPPDLAITSHSDLQLLNVNVITLTGTASDAGRGDRGITSVTVNNTRASNDTANGSDTANWSRSLSLVDGTNRITVVARDGSARSATNIIRIISDTVPPSLAITNLKAGIRLTTPVSDVKGTALDNDRVSKVWVSVNSSNFVASSTANNWSNWVLSAQTLKAGMNLVRAYATDAAGNKSPTNTVAFTAMFTSPLTLQIAGRGMVRGATNGQKLEVGKSYQLVATPAGGWLFSNWSGTITTTNTRLTFPMQLGTALQANFVTNLFLAGKGAYNGLFYPNNSPSVSNAGSFALTLATRGTFSGRLFLAGTTLRFSGGFHIDGQAQVAVARRGAPPLQMTLRLIPADRAINGLVDGGVWQAPLSSDRAATAAGALAGTYTLLVAGGDDAAVSPPGFGVASVTVRATGGVKVSGTLADSSTITAQTSLAADGVWPLYSSFFNGRGVFLGWMQCNSNRPALWLKSPGTTSSPYYSSGFDEVRTVVVARYTPPAAGRSVLNWTNGFVILGGGNLPAPLTNQIMLVNNQIHVLGGSVSNLSLRLSSNNGLVSGSFVHPVTRTTAMIKAALVQDPPNVSPLPSGGWFLGTNQGGYVRFEP